MKTEVLSVLKRLLLPVFLVILLPALSLAEEKQVETIDVIDIKPFQVSLEKLKSGLAVIYFLDFFERDVRMLPLDEKSEYKTVRGDPIAELNHQFGEEEVFESGSNRGVGMRIYGYMRITEPGVYELQALSNDGIIMTMSDKLLLKDPEQHSDRLSNIARVTIENPGYYPILIEYFQRKGTAALKLFWKVPGAEDFVPVPPEVYAHLE